MEGEAKCGGSGGDPLDPQYLMRALRGCRFGRQIVCREWVSSTNALAKELAVSGADEGLLVMAEGQTGGRGRLGRSWVSKAGTNLLISVVLRPDLPGEDAFLMTMILALATVDAVEKIYGLKTRIKWPNDLFAGDRKLGGILTECSLRERAIAYVILGLGLNVHWRPAPGADISTPATSLYAETGRRLSRNELLAAIMARLERYYARVLEGERTLFFERWNTLSAVVGRRVEIRSTEGRVQGTALRIERDGSLVLQDTEGRCSRVRAGDVSLRLQTGGS